MFHQRQNVTGGGYSQLWCLMLSPLNLNLIGGAQVILRPLYLVPIWVAWPDLPEGVPLEKIKVNPSCCSPLEIFWIPWSQTFSPSYSRPLQSIGCFTSSVFPLMRNFKKHFSHHLVTFWLHAGGGPGWLCSINWYHIQQFRFSGDIPPRGSLYVSQNSGLTI